jgi:hypothetical protein
MKRFLLRKGCSKDGDKIHVKTNCKIEKRCLDDTRHAKNKLQY